MDDGPAVVFGKFEVIRHRAEIRSGGDDAIDVACRGHMNRGPCYSAARARPCLVADPATLLASSRHGRLYRHRLPESTSERSPATTTSQATGMNGSRSDWKAQQKSPAWNKPGSIFDMAIYHRS